MGRRDVSEAETSLRSPHRGTGRHRASHTRLLGRLAKLVDQLVSDHRASDGQRFEAIEALRFGGLGGQVPMGQSFPSALREDLSGATLLLPGSLFDREQD